MDEPMVGTLLRHWRSRLTPTALGLPPRTRRAGVTQADIAAAARCSLRTYAGIENGHTRPSTELLDTLGDVLHLSTDERHTLWRAAVGTARPAASFATDHDSGLARIVDALPYPAYVTDAAWHVLAANRAVAQWFVDFGAMPPAERNIGKWIFGHPHTRHVFVRWERFADEFVARVRALSAALGNVATFDDWLTEMRAYPDFEARWTADPLVNIDPPTVRRFFREPGKGLSDPGVPLDMVILSPMGPEDGRRLVVFVHPDGYSNTTLSDLPADQLCPMCTTRSTR
ncbi:helix-turn-helix domain-containing protein [Salinispora arenicola]|uniref:Helix-turn-helix protein n=1 Tax=Salinispora arenicola TaxID=168697 RepID=A0A542XUP1_SALAC|nr:helix-turn-helix domain-containing protein [Salinispora arenicola]TQL39522.1 helix-turn-helix protein [Salinispora arenicola]GIM86440.1 transcriptional regulator [Salinispora arenicola]